MNWEMPYFECISVAVALINAVLISRLLNLINVMSGFVLVPVAEVGVAKHLANDNHPREHL